MTANYPFVDEFQTLVSKPEDMLDQLNVLHQNYAYNINLRDIALYSPEEIPCGQQYLNVTTPVGSRSWVQPHNIVRKIIECGALPNAGLKQVAHGIVGISNNFFLTRIYGAAREPAGAAPRPFFIPMPNSGNYQIELMIDNTNINIRTVANLTAFTYSIVVLEYWKV